MTGPGGQRENRWAGRVAAGIMRGVADKDPWYDLPVLAGR